MPRIQDFAAFNAVREAGMAKLAPSIPRNAVGMGTCGRGNGAEGLYHAFVEAIDRTQKYIICNADEDDPGAYMNRNAKSKTIRTPCSKA
jgi:NADH:ubiquinone oxidoreductase subunit F (NADH-binding)